jgi:uncharacterized protein
MIGLFDPWYFIVLSPALLLAGWAQMRVRSAYQHGMQEPAPLSGAAAARYILDSAGLSQIPIEETHGQLSDHYDPQSKVVRLSSEVYHTRSLAAVGIAAHEVGHALQDAKNYAPLVFRNLAVPAATFGPGLAMVMLILGGVLWSKPLIILGLIAFGSTVVFQLINLPVEFDASARAKRYLNEMQIVDQRGAAVVNDVLSAAAWTYVAGTLQAILTLVYLAMQYGGILGRRDE